MIRTLSLSVLAASIAVGVYGAHAAEMKLKAAYFIAAKKSLARIAFDKWVDKVNAEGKGLVQIDKVVSVEAVPSRQIPNALRRGVIDIGGAPPSYFSKFVPGVAGYSAATIGPQEQRKNGAFKLADDALRKRANAHLLAQFGRGVRFHLFTSKPVRTLADFKGMRLRSTNTYKAFFNALGAQPIQMSRREIFTAMERGVVSGFSNLNSEVKALGWGEVVKYRIDPSFYDTIVWIAINQDTWKKMSADQKAFMDKMAHWLESDINDWFASNDVAAGAELAKAGAFKVIKLADDEAKQYVKMAYDASWKTIVKRSPDFGVKARKLLTNQ